MAGAIDKEATLSAIEAVSHGLRYRDTRGHRGNPR
jgi:hypothetical protein